MAKVSFNAESVYKEGKKNEAWFWGCFNLASTRHWIL